MTIKEFKAKYGLRQIAGSSVDEWRNAKTGLEVAPCSVGFVIRSDNSNSPSRVAADLAAADKLATLAILKITEAKEKLKKEKVLNAKEKAFKAGAHRFRLYAGWQVAITAQVKDELGHEVAAFEKVRCSNKSVLSFKVDGKVITVRGHKPGKATISCKITVGKGAAIQALIGRFEVLPSFKAALHPETTNLSWGPQ